MQGKMVTIKNLPIVQVVEKLQVFYTWLSGHWTFPWNSFTQTTNLYDLLSTHLHSLLPNVLFHSQSPGKVLCAHLRDIHVGLLTLKTEQIYCIFQKYFIICGAVMV